jgi:geranylgeranyl pyrophosphate synthase
LTLFGPAAADIVIIEAALKEEIDGDPPEVSPPMADLFEAGGKRLRPALVLLSAMCGEYDLAKVVPAAMAVELTHAATLVHDDVIDRSPTRRGRPTVSARLGDEPAIVIGDFYFAKAYELAARTHLPEVVAILARTVMAICAGEVGQQAIRYQYSTGIEEYMRRIEAKTATLTGACCEIGALLGGLDDRKRSALRNYGRSLGLAFQIADDVLDYVGSEDEVGKPIGHDIAEGFATLPLMLAGIHIDDGHRLDGREALDVVTAVRSGDGPQRALERARDHANASRDQLRALPDTDATHALAALTDYVVSRKL